MNTVKPGEREIQRQLTELDERVTRLETDIRSSRISNREMYIRIVLLVLLIAFLCGFAYFTFR